MFTGLFGAGLKFIETWFQHFRWLRGFIQGRFRVFIFGLDYACWLAVLPPLPCLLSLLACWLWLSPSIPCLLAGLLAPFPAAVPFRIGRFLKKNSRGNLKKSREKYVAFVCSLLYVWCSPEVIVPSKSPSSSSTVRTCDNRSISGHTR